VDAMNLLTIGMACRGHLVRRHFPSGGKSDFEGYLSDDSDDGSGDGALWATQFGHSA